MKNKKFIGHTGITLSDSRLAYEPEELPQKTNVVYIVLDDVGFAQLECFGSTIHTPNINRLADTGLRYNNFHTTAICSATRASLLTGANHHSVGVGTVIDFATGFPNSIGHLNPEYATLAEVLKEYNYGTYAVGKWHLAPLTDICDQGPFDNWPLQKGFDKFYGFMEGYTDQYHPKLIKDNSSVKQPKDSKDGYHLSEDLSDQAIHYLFQHITSHPEQPFFLYLAYGAGHTPHQVPKEYVDRYKGKFDEGWDAIREKWFQRQKEIGIIPQDAKLTPRNEYVKAWDSLTADQKRVYAKYMEVYAGFLEHTDEQIGRVLDYLEEIGERDNTIIVLLSDNGASAEGGQEGRFNDERGVDCFEEGVEFKFALEHIDEIGSEWSAPHYPMGWANAGNTPFQWYKSWVHSGGVKDPMIISYPEGIQDKGAIRSQYHHVSDVTPTILEALNFKKPDSIKGIPQNPMEGTSLFYTFTNAEEPTRKPVQYYEQVGNRGVWKDGWKLVANHFLKDNYEEDEWELYHTDVDYSEADNLASQYPEKVEALKNVWFAEAGKYQVFPLSIGSYLSNTEEGANEDMYSLHSGKVIVPEENYTYKNIIEPFMSDRKLIFNHKNNIITAKIIHKAENEGTLYAVGTRYGGYTLYIRENRLHYVYNYHLMEFYKAVSSPLPEGELSLRVETRLIGSDEGEVILYVNGEKAASTHITHFINGLEIYFSAKDGNSTSVDPENELPFEYPSTIRELEFKAASFEVSRLDLLEHFFEID